MRREEEELPPFQASQGTSENKASKTSNRERDRGGKVSQVLEPVQAEVEGQSHQLHQRPWSRHRRAELQAFPVVLFWLASHHIITKVANIHSQSV